MRKYLKKWMVCASVAIVAAGAYLTYRQVLPQEPISDLTLANIEALSAIGEVGDVTHCVGGPGICVIVVCPDCPIIYGHNVELNGGLEFIYPPQV